ncbi:glycosyltransferase family 8 protein [Oceanobacillus locisalsi]|uniref:Glycosyltransferase family 8 protein n=1 Tax=Oceanobacillus locisalsi TaxID=546107 RepID=A0ABW3NJ46_9BACI
MNILVTLNSHYLHPLKVMLTSLFSNNPGESFSIYLMHSTIDEQDLKKLELYIQDYGHTLTVLTVDDAYFANTPTLKHFTTEMYYRLLAFKFLPENLDRILYIDPDILVLNPVRELYDMEMEGYLYAAAYHSFINVKDVNKLRLNAYEIDEYYNSGVLQMNLPLQREWVKEQDIFTFVEQNRKRLLLPDQDILNALYSTKIKSLDEKIFNYDARYYRYYKLKTNGFFDIDHVLRYTVFLHFCGKKKPWHKNYNGKFHALYKHYENMAFKEEVR